MAQFTRRLFCLASAGVIATPAWAEPGPDVTADQDFDELWETLGGRYCFFGDKATDWNKVRDVYRPMAVKAETEKQFTDAIRRTLNELYDAHTHLADPPDGSPRWPPYDLLVEPAGDAALIKAVQETSAAAAAGLRPGDRITAVEGLAVASVAAGLMPVCLARPDPAADRHAWNVAVAGHRARARRLTVRPVHGPDRIVDLVPPTASQEADLSSRRLDGGLGYIRIASFADAATVATFDAALADLKDAPGLILDVRRNGGGDTAVARPIMGRFITERKPYARMRRRQGQGLSEFWSEYVDPRGPFTYAGPVVVLTDAWSGSMAEGFPMGMRGLGRGRIVGEPMMGLGAAVYEVRLDRTGVQAQYSGEPVYDVAGQPRWLLQPDVRTAPGADILAAGVKELMHMIAG